MNRFISILPGHCPGQPVAGHLPSAAKRLQANLGTRWTSVGLLTALLTMTGCGGGGGAGGTDAGASVAAATASAPDNTGSATAPTDASALGARRVATKPTTTTTTTATYDSEGWALWQQRSTSVYSGPYALVGDPSVLRDGTLLRMFHTCYDVVSQGPAICQVTSTDGLSWTPVPVQDPLAGRMLRARPGSWEDTHETPLIVKFKNEYLLYFAGYRNQGGHLKSFPIQIGLATSTDGQTFTRVQDQPVLPVTPGGLDSDAVFSPTIIEHDGGLLMLYTAYCLDTCTLDKGAYLMAATSPDGRQWTKTGRPVISPAKLPPGVRGVAEAHLTKGADQMFYLFVSYIYDTGLGQEIGIGRAASPYGPWELSSAPIVRKTSTGFANVGPIAPSVLVEDGRVRMWFHGVSSVPQAQIGYAEAKWPLHAP